MLKIYVVIAFATLVWHVFYFSVFVVYINKKSKWESYRKRFATFDGEIEGF